jgi:hypothetical protein
MHGGTTTVCTPGGDDGRLRRQQRRRPGRLALPDLDRTLFLIGSYLDPPFLFYLPRHSQYCVAYTACTDRPVCDAHLQVQGRHVPVVTEQKCGIFCIAIVYTTY